MSHQVQCSKIFLAEDFIRLSKRESNARARVRLLGLHYLQSSKNYTDVGSRLRVKRHTVRRWHQQYEQQGLAGLYDKSGRGRICRLTQGEQALLAEQLRIQQKERTGGRLTVHDICALLKSDYHKSYSPSGAYGLLKQVGMSWITSRSQHPKADEAKQASFKKTS